MSPSYNYQYSNIFWQQSLIFNHQVKGEEGAFDNREVCHIILELSDPSAEHPQKVHTDIVCFLMWWNRRYIHTELLTNIFSMNLTMRE